MAALPIGHHEMANILEQLSQGLRIAGGALSPQAFQADVRKQEQLQSLKAQREEMLMQAATQAVQNGALSPDKFQMLKQQRGWNIPDLGPNVQTQKAQGEMQTQAEADALRKQIDASIATKYGQPTPQGTSTGMTVGPDGQAVLDPVVLDNPANFKETETERAMLYQQTGNPLLMAEARKIAADLRAEEKLHKENAWAGITPSQYTPESLADYQRSVINGTPDRSLLRADPRQTRQAGASKVEIKTGESAAKEIGPMLKESRDEAVGALEQVDAALRIKKALDAGAVMAGPTATLRLRGAQIAAMLGIGGKDTTEAITNTRNAIRGLAEFTISVRKKLRGQGQVTEYEQKTLQKAYSGEIEDLTVEEIRVIANLTERLGRLSYKQHEQQLENMRNTPELRGLVPFYSVPAMPKEETGPAETGAVGRPEQLEWTQEEEKELQELEQRQKLERKRAP